MSRTIEIRGLTDAQCDALADEAKARNVKFFDHCRDRLLAGLEVASRGIDVKRIEQSSADHVAARRKVLAVPPAEVDRIGRLEAMMAQMGETLQMLASNPGYAVQDEPVADNAEIDVDDVIGQSLQVAERQGLTAIEREAPAQAGGVRHLGQRRPAPFSVHTVPQHLRNL